MGYTHYWKINAAKITTSKTNTLKYAKALQDIAKIVETKKSILANGVSDKGSKPETANGISLNGRGDDGHETFALGQSPVDGFDFCKTAQKPYDVVVVACLARLAEVPGVIVSSDGGPGDWDEGVALASKVLKRKVKNPIEG